MSRVLALARPELLALRPYVPGVYEPGLIRLNANESPWRAPEDHTERGLNIYPPPRPDAVRAALADHYGVDRAQLLVTRGSSEAIDVLIRGFCRAGQDSIVITPPTFDMYRLYANIQNAAVTEVALREQDDFALDTAGVAARCVTPTKLVFLCTPNNPTGTSFPPSAVETVCKAAGGRALVVIDEAYHEFADREDFSALLTRFDNVVLLRTLSKFVSLAGARCGALIAAAEIVDYLGKVLPPYTFPTPSIEHVLAVLTSKSVAASRERVTVIKQERSRVAAALARASIVRKVYPSDANFILLRTRSASEFAERAHRAGILVRRFPGQPELSDCIRVTIGRREDNDRLIDAICRENATHAD